MNGLELFNKYTSFRDFSGSPKDEYAQFLETLLINIGEDLFPLLKEAELSGKKLTLVDTEIDFISVDDLVIA